MHAGAHFTCHRTHWKVPALPACARMCAARLSVWIGREAQNLTTKRSPSPSRMLVESAAYGWISCSLQYSDMYCSQHKASVPNTPKGQTLQTLHSCKYNEDIDSACRTQRVCLAAAGLWFSWRQPVTLRSLFHPAISQMTTSCLLSRCACSPPSVPPS